VFFINLRNLNIVTICFLFDAKRYYLQEDRGKENFKAKYPCLMAEKDNSEIRSYVYQSWSAQYVNCKTREI